MIFIKESSIICISVWVNMKYLHCCSIMQYPPELHRCLWNNRRNRKVRCPAAMDVRREGNPCALWLILWTGIQYKTISLMTRVTLSGKPRRKLQRSTILLEAQLYSIPCNKTGAVAKQVDNAAGLSLPVRITGLFYTRSGAWSWDWQRLWISDFEWNRLCVILQEGMMMSVDRNLSARHRWNPV